MKRTIHYTFYTLMYATLAAASASHAQTVPSSQTSYLVPYAGWFDVTQGDNSSAQFGVEYRAKAYAYGLRPGGGANVSSDGSLYGYGGVFWDIPLLGGKWFFTPNIVAGLYRKSDGKKLGGPIEFRSGLELSYALPRRGERVGVAFNHISNASIYDRNPGAETLLVNYHIPMGW